MLIEIIFETTFNLFENLLNCVNYIEGWEPVVEKCLNFAGLKRPYANLNLTENKDLLKNPSEDQDLEKIMLVLQLNISSAYPGLNLSGFEHLDSGQW